MDINQLTPEQKEALKQQIRTEEQAEKEKHAAAIATYKKIASDTVNESFPRIENLSDAIRACKALVRDNFDAIIDMKRELYNTEQGQQSHTFINETGDKRIKIGFYVLDNYDDTVDVGVSKVMAWIESFAIDEKSQFMVDTIKKLLAKDAKGTIKAQRVLQLQQMADKSGDKDFIEGVKIIRDAYKPIESKSYIKAEYKDTHGAWLSVPLGMTEA